MKNSTQRKSWSQFILAFVAILLLGTITCGWGCSPRTEFDYWQHVAPEEEEMEMDNTVEDAGDTATGSPDGGTEADVG